MREETRNLINKYLLIFIGSSLIFFNYEFKIEVVMAIVIPVWVWIFVNYKMRKNIELLDTILVSNLAIVSSYVLSEILIHDGLSSRTANIILIYLLPVILYPFYSHYIHKYKQQSPGTSDTAENLLPKRKKDLERFSSYIDTFDIVGLNGRWGSGKTFLLNEFIRKEKAKKDRKEEYEFIQIDVLSSNLNELQLILVKELERVMHKNRISSKYSNKLKRFLDNDSLFFKITSLAFDSTSTYFEVIKGFQDDLKK